jgi:hypothetical protein
MLNGGKVMPMIAARTMSALLGLLLAPSLCVASPASF